MLSVNIFYRKIIEVLTMNNNELLKNLAISCNHSDETQRIYRLALTNYASYFNQDLHELLAVCSSSCGRAETLNLTIHDLLFRGSIEKIYAIETLVSTKEFININPPDIIITMNWIFQTMFLHRSFH